MGSKYVVLRRRGLWSLRRYCKLIILIIGWGPSVAHNQGITAPLISFVSTGATPLEAVKQIASQARVPIGLIFGLDQERLCSVNRAFDIRSATPLEAMIEATKDTGYLITNEDSVLVVSAPDLNRDQRALIDHHFDSFSPSGAWTMAGLGAQLTGWLWLQAGLADGYSSSAIYSLTAHKIHVNIPAGTTQEVANHIVSLDGKGMWVFKLVRPKATAAGDELVQIVSYLEDERSLKQLSCKRRDRGRNGVAFPFP